ncbi:hypothetical protein PG994_015194 [Apiospora phragmitis]|uniref:Uncharacterized protein n=1 Tax=Apiospora phragmitis TaxID=2905665 RepID=A0ABR1SVT3_9PEZI
MDIHSDQTHTSSPSPTATVIGLYGIPGSGKTFLLSQLRQQQGFEHFELYEGSHVIGSLVPGGLDAFKRAEEHDKASWRERAINLIKNDYVPAELIAQRRTNDTQRTRPSASLSHLRAWKDAEKTQLRMLYRQHGILFCFVSPQATTSGQVPTLLRDFQHHSEEHNLSRANNRLDEALGAQKHL